MVNWDLNPLRTVEIEIIILMFSIFKWEERGKPVKPPTPVKPPAPTKLPSDIFEECRAVLPEGYAQNVLDMEMKLEFDDTFTLETVQGLNELYRVPTSLNVDRRRVLHQCRPKESFSFSAQTRQSTDTPSDTEPNRKQR